MSVPMREDDPAYWMLQKGFKDLAEGKEGWITKRTVHNDNCYICNDHEFALMGLPLCYPCPVLIDGVECGSHVPADDEECDEGHNIRVWHTTKGEEY